MKWFFILLMAASVSAADLGAMWGTAEAEAEYYELVTIPIPHGIPLRVGSMDALDDRRLAVGTRKGDIYILDGAFESDPNPTYHLFASGQDEIFGLSHKGKDFFVTQFGGVNRVSDSDGDGVADRFYTLSNNWGYAEGHEFAFGSKPDPGGNIWVALGLTASYHSRQLFRGWCLKVTPDGKTLPVCSGLRSPGGVAANKEGVMFAIESQGPWNGSCSLKHLKQAAFLGHPASYNWYEFSGIPKPELEPNNKSRLTVEKKRVKELLPYAVLFPYIKMGRSISGFQLNQTKGKLPNNFVVMLPKVTIPEQIIALVSFFEVIEEAFNLKSGVLKMEMMVETTQSIMDHNGTNPLYRFILDFPINLVSGWSPRPA